MRLKTLSSPLFSSPKAKHAKPVLITEHSLIVLIFHSRELGSFSSPALLLSKECEKSFLESLGSGQEFLASAWNKTSILKSSSYFLPGSIFLPGQLQFWVLFLEKKGGIPLFPVQGCVLKADKMLLIFFVQDESKCYRNSNAVTSC